MLVELSKIHAFIYLKTSKLYYIFTSRIIYDHVNNFWDNSTPIFQTESLTNIYTGPEYMLYIHFHLLLYILYNIYIVIYSV